MRETVDGTPRAAAQAYAYLARAWEMNEEHEVRKNNKLTRFEQSPSISKSYFQSNSYAFHPVSCAASGSRKGLTMLAAETLVQR